MAWITRGRYRYYSRSVREGKTVRQVRFGNGDLAELAANLDELGRLDRQDRARAWCDEQARHEATDGLLEGPGNSADLLAEAALTRAGYHRHDRGSWRRRRIMINTNITSAAEPITPEDIREVVEAARRGERSALPVLRELLDAHPAIWHGLGDLAAHAERAWVDLIAGPDPALSEAIARKLQSIKVELAGAAPSPLEKLLVDRVAASWLQVHHADALISQARDRGLSLAQFDHLVRRQERAQRGYLSAIKALATVRKLLPAATRPATKGPECVAEALRREAKTARHGGQAERVDKAPGVNTKGRRKPVAEPGPARPTGASIPKALRDRMRGMVGSEN